MNATFYFFDKKAMRTRLTLCSGYPEYALISDKIYTDSVRKGIERRVASWVKREADSVSEITLWKGDRKWILQ